MLKNVSPGLIENVKDLKISLNELTVYDFDVYSSIEVYYKIAHKLNDIIRELSRFEGLVSDEVIKQNNKLLYLLDEGLENEVIKEIDNLRNQKFFDYIVNVTLINKLNDRIDEVNSQLEQKASEVDLEVQRKRIDSFISLENGSTTGDAELIDGRIDYNGETHTNIGGAIRSVEELYTTGKKYVTLSWVQGYVTDTSSNDSVNHFIKTKDFIKSSESKILKAKTGYKARYVGYDEYKNAVFYSDFITNDLILKDYSYYKINVCKIDMSTPININEGLQLCIKPQSFINTKLNDLNVCINELKDESNEMIKCLSNVIPSGSEFNSPIVDFVSFTNKASNNRYYSWGFVEKDCYLKKINIKTDDNSIKILIARYEDSILTIKKDLGTFNVINGVVSVNSNFKLSKDDQILIAQNNIYFIQGPIIENKLILESNFDISQNGTSSSIYLPVNITFENVRYDLYKDLLSDVLNNKDLIKNNKDSIKKIDEQVEILSKNKLWSDKNIYKTVYKLDVNSEHNLTLNNWVIDYDNKYIYPAAKGGYVSNTLTNYMVLNKKYEADKRKARFVCTIHDDTVLNFHTIRGIRTGQIPNESMYELNIPNGKLIMYKNVNRYITNEIAVEQSIDIPIVDGGKYIIELEKNDFTSYFRIINYNTLEQCQVSIDGWDAGTQIQQYALTWGNGVNAPKIHSIDVSILSNPNAIIVGDSITEGYGMSNTSGDNSFQNRYAEYLRNKIGNSIISGASSNTINDIIDKFDSEIIPLKPKFLICTIGTNGNPTLSNYQTILNKCKENDIELILNYIPCHTDGRHINTNKIIESLNLRGCRFDIATSINNDLSKGCDTRLLPDGCHPNYLGSLEMIKRIDIDLDII